jgi:hypothetical protein
MKRVSPPYATQVEQVPNPRRPEGRLYRYEVRDKRSGRVVFEGTASDAIEAVDSMNAWINYAGAQQAA